MGPHFGLYTKFWRKKKDTVVLNSSADYKINVNQECISALPERAQLREWWQAGTRGRFPPSSTASCILSVAIVPARNTLLYRCPQSLSIDNTRDYLCKITGLLLFVCEQL